MEHKRKVYLLGACRTPIGKMGGALASMSAVQLGAVVVKEALRRASVPAEYVEHVYMGCVLQAALGQNAARQATIMAGLPYTTTAQTVNIVCGSGLDALNSAARMIQAGDADIVVAGGMESMSNAPFALGKARFGYRMGSPMIDSSLIDTMVKDGLWDAIYDYHMGITAENIAERWGITRLELDAFSEASQKKAAFASTEGHFKDEIVPVKITSKKNEITVCTDEGPRPETTLENLSKLKPAFKANGVVTAGNSSGINDGAAAIVLASEEKVSELHLLPQAEWVGGALGGVDPAIMGIGSVVSTKKLFEKINISMDDIDLVEANEAFAAQSIAVQRELKIPDEKLNINGGAIALGHPIGASGARIIVTLIHALGSGQSGLATLCIGGGMGCSTVIRKIY